MIYIVMGFHKSGTSMMARILHHSGVKMGEEHFIQPDHINKEGYYENREFTDLNQRILWEHNLSWDNPEEVLSTEEDVKGTIERNYSKVWGWKDPRTTFTLPCYLPYLKDFVLIFMRRNKEAVLKSMEKTHRVQSPADFSELYDLYWKQNEKWIKRYPSIVLDYDSIINNVKPKLRHYEL